MGVNDVTHSVTVSSLMQSMSPKFIPHLKAYQVDFLRGMLVLFAFQSMRDVI
jgi:hypothetical protein